MNWTELLKSEMNATFHATEKLMEKVQADQLEWKPSSDNNWMTMGQLLMHINQACGICCRGFVTGDWGMPEGASMELPTAEMMPAVENLDQAFAGLKEDWELALAMVDQAGEDDLANKMVAAPWAPMEFNLGKHMLQMVMHLQQHKAQLFYYLKLLGQPVNTMDFWGMG